jgi:hypothetical protein
MRALTLPWSRAFNLVCEVALNHMWEKPIILLHFLRPKMNQESRKKCVHYKGRRSPSNAQHCHVKGKKNWTLSRMKVHHND